MKILRLLAVASAAFFIAFAAFAQQPGSFTNGALIIGKGTGQGFGQLGTTRKGDVPCFDGSIWNTLAGNNSGTRFLSQDSSGNCAWASASGIIPFIVPPQGRLTLTTATPLMRANVTAVSTIYYDCYSGNQVPVYSGTVDVLLGIASCEISDVVPTSSTGVANSGGVFDLWLINSASTLTLCHATNGAGGGWASDVGSTSNGSNVARAVGTASSPSGYSQLDFTSRPYITNRLSITHCYNGATDKGPISANQATYAGSFYTTAAGQTGMNFSPGATAGGANPFLGLYNGYNRERMCVASYDNTAVAWTTVNNVWEVANIGGTGVGLNNRVNWVDGLAQSNVEAEYEVLAATSSGGNFVDNGVVFDATTGTPGGVTGSFTAGSTSNSGTEIAKNSMVGPGLHFAQAMQNAATGKWFGVAYSANTMMVRACLNM